MTKDHEFPYDWNYGQVVYVTFLSAIFGGTIVLEGKKITHDCRIEILVVWIVSKDS